MRRRSVTFRLLPAAIPTFAAARARHLWLTHPGAADPAAPLRVWEYEGGALALRA